MESRNLPQLNPSGINELKLFLQLQRPSDGGDREDAGDDGGGDRVRELHLRERRGTLRLHRTRHDHGQQWILLF